MFKLFIQSEEAELNQNTRLQLSRMVFDLEDVSKRGIKISNVITLPESNTNLRLAGYPNRINSNNESFENNYPYVLTDRNNILSSGVVIVKSWGEKEGIKIQMAEGYDFYSLIGSRKMNDLDLFQWDVTFNSTTFGNINTKTGSVWLWALANNASDITKTALANLVYSRPSYRHYRLLDEIITQAGYTADYGNLLTNTNLDNIGSLGNTQDFAVTDNKRRFDETVIPTGLIDLSGAVVEFVKVGNTLLSGTTNLVNQLYKTSYVVKGVVRSKFSGTINISSTLGGNSVTEQVTYNKGVTEINYRTDEFEINSSTNFSVSSDVTLEVFRIYAHINESDIVEIAGNWDAGAGISILDGFQILSDYNLPAQTQLQFLKVLLKQLFIKIDIDNLNKVVKMERFKDVLSQNNAIDLSGKSIRYPNYESGEFLAQLNIMSYENDDDISESLGQNTFTSNNKNADKVKSFLEIVEYSASNQVLISGNTTVDVPIYDVTNATRQSVKERIVSFAVGTGIPFTCEFTGVSMQQIYSNNYIDLINNIKRERTTSIGLLLNLLEFNKIIDKPIIYLSEFDSYYLVLSLSGFEVGSYTNANVIKYG